MEILKAHFEPVLLATYSPGPEPAILDWYGHWGIKLEGSGGMLSQKSFKIRHSEIASEAMFGPKCYWNLPTSSFNKKRLKLPEMTAMYDAHVSPSPICALASSSNIAIYIEN